MVVESFNCGLNMEKLLFVHVENIISVLYVKFYTNAGKTANMG